MRAVKTKKESQARRIALIERIQARHAAILKGKQGFSKKLRWVHAEPERELKREAVNKPHKRRFYKYEITKGEYQARLDQQKARCKICKRLGKKLCVDHCHKTGIIRGLLCYNCNTALGLFADNTHRLRRAILYILRQN